MVTFRVLPEPLIETHSGQEALGYLSTRVDHEADLSRGLVDNLNGDEGGARRPVAGIARVGQGLDDKRIGAARLLEHRHRSVAVLDIGRLRIEHQGAAGRPCPPEPGACALSPSCARRSFGGRRFPSY